MPRIDNYYLTPGLPQDLDRFACKLIEKAFKQGYTIIARTRDKTHSEALDRLLWTFRDRSFIPHGQASEPDNPILIAHEAVLQDALPYRLLVQIHPVSQETSFAAYERIVEIMDEAHRLNPNHQERLQRYQADGYEVHEHDQHLTV
ncbi:DNA polymerase III chi subunit HolC [mine drainage metagenome]|uniref:DNA polymerase III chi subunit HolC n=1 Tax=mine drainage metagenome TaxID=410659 RepID=T0ZU73_9ZZZZ